MFKDFRGKSMLIIEEQQKLIDEVSKKEIENREKIVKLKESFETQH